MFHQEKDSLKWKLTIKRYSKPKKRKDKLKQHSVLTKENSIHFPAPETLYLFHWMLIIFKEEKPTEQCFTVCGFCQQSLSQLGCFTGMEISIASPRNSKSMGLERAQISGTLTWNVNNGLRDSNPTLFFTGCRSNRKRLVYLSQSVAEQEWKPRTATTQFNLLCSK